MLICVKQTLRTFRAFDQRHGLPISSGGPIEENFGQIGVPETVAFIAALFGLLEVPHSTAVKSDRKAGHSGFSVANVSGRLLADFWQ